MITKTKFGEFAKQRIMVYFTERFRINFVKNSIAPKKARLVAVDHLIEKLYCIDTM